MVKNKKISAKHAVLVCPLGNAHVDEGNQNLSDIIEILVSLSFFRLSVLDD